MIALTETRTSIAETFDRCFSCRTLPQDEFALLEMARRGDPEAFNELVLKYQDAVYRQAFWMMGETEAAEDAAQEAFIRAFQAMPSFHGSTFKAWLLKITSNLCIDMLRYRSIRPTAPLAALDEDGEEIESAAWMTDPSPSTEAIIESEELAESVQACLARLDLDYRMALVLVDIQELDYQQAAEIMHIRLGTLKSRVARGRMRLRSALQEYYN
jgi:RNA polymerase sigma-70 factor (ECF subfamily)